MRKIIITPSKWEFNNFIKNNIIDKNCEFQTYKSLNILLENINKIHSNYDRIVVVNEDGIAPFMFCSKINKVVAAPIYDEHSAYMTPLHNNTKIMCLGYEISTHILIASMINIFFKTKYEGLRHASRIDMLNLEDKVGGC